MTHRTIPLAPTAMAALFAATLATPTWAGEEKHPLAIDPANNTKPESQYNDLPERRAPSDDPTAESGAMDLDGSLSSDQPLDGAAPSPYSARSAPGRE